MILLDTTPTDSAENKHPGDTLSWLLSPMSEREFFAESWEKKYCVVRRNDSNYYQTLFSRSDFDSVVEFGDLRSPGFRVIMDGKGIEPEEFRQADGRLDLEQLRRLYSEGSTIIVNRLDKYWRPLAEFVQALQVRLSFTVLANAYLTPPTARGLRPHYDTHDVFVLQVGGIKEWRLYQPEVLCPLSGTAPRDGLPREDLPEPELVELRAGDVLYLPRGWIHEAETLDESSLHLTLGVYPPLWADVLAKVIAGLTLREESLRHSLPPGYLQLPDFEQTLTQRLQEMISLVGKDGSATEAFEMLADEFVHHGRSISNGQFIAELDKLTSIDLRTRLARRPYLFSRVVDVENSVGLQFANSLVQGPAEFRSAMEFVSASATPFAVSDIPGLIDEQKVCLARRLVRDGLLFFSELD